MCACSGIRTSCKPKLRNDLWISQNPTRMLASLFLVAIGSIHSVALIQLLLQKCLFVTIGIVHFSSFRTMSLLPRSARCVLSNRLICSFLFFRNSDPKFANAANCQWEVQQPHTFKITSRGQCLGCGYQSGTVKVCLLFHLGMWLL